MKILGLLGSYRKNGNSDILAKEALMGAEEAGAQVEVLRLTDCRIQSCQGFGLCPFRKEGCPVDTDFGGAAGMGGRSQGRSPTKPAAAGREIRRPRVGQATGLMSLALLRAHLPLGFRVRLLDQGFAEQDLREILLDDQ